MTTDTARRRELLAAASLLLPALAVLASRPLLGDRLPAELASHWSSTGAADDTMATGSLLALALALSGLPAIAGLVLAAFGRGSRLLLACLGLVAGLGASAWAASVGSTLAAGTADGAPLGAWLLVLLAGLLFWVVPALIAPASVPAPRTGAESLPLGDTETGAWSHTITGRVFAIGAVALAIGALTTSWAMIANGAGDLAVIPAIVLGTAAVLMLAFSSLRVTADRRGLRVVSRLLGLPLRRIPLEAITSAGTVDLRPSEWGGWGYRLIPGRSALILSAGPGLVVTTTDRREFAISLSDPETPAALLEALRVRG